LEKHSTKPKTDFRRIHHRLPAEEYIGRKWFFVTMCCHNRGPIFSNPGCATWVLEFLRSESILHEFLIDAYCAMPDHLHFLAFGISVTSDLLKFSQSFKQKTTFRYLETKGAKLWQDNFYDHILRSYEEPTRVASYIWLNPVREGLCKDFQEYPHSGSLSRPWKTPIAASWMPPWKRERMPA
jgi:putative transposase